VRIGVRGKLSHVIPYTVTSRRALGCKHTEAVCLGAPEHDTHMGADLLL